MQFNRFLTIPGLFTRQPGVNMKRGKYGCIVLTPGLVPLLCNVGNLSSSDCYRYRDSMLYPIAECPDRGR